MSRPKTLRLVRLNSPQVRSGQQKPCSILHRMNFIQGHLKANSKMIEEDRYCIDIIRQNQAVISALKKVNEQILKEHLDSCVTTAIRGKNEKEKQKMLGEIMEVFEEKK